MIGLSRRPDEHWHARDSVRPAVFLYGFQSGQDISVGVVNSKDLDKMIHCGFGVASVVLKPTQMIVSRFEFFGVFLMFQACDRSLQQVNCRRAVTIKRLNCDPVEVNFRAHESLATRLKKRGVSPRSTGWACAAIWECSSGCSKRLCAAVVLAWLIGRL